MPIDIRNTPDVSPQVIPPFTQNVERSPYLSTTDDLLDKLIQAVVGGGGGSQPYLDIEFDWVMDENNDIHFIVVIVDGTGVSQVVFFDSPNGTPTTPVGKLKPISKPNVHYKTIQLDGNVGQVAVPWEAETIVNGEVIGQIGNEYIVEPGFRYFDIVYKAETQLGAKFNVNNIGYRVEIGDVAITPLYKRGDPNYQLRFDERYRIFVNPGCVFEITEVRG